MVIEKDIELKVDNTSKEFWNIFFNQFKGKIKSLSIGLFNWDRYSVVKQEKIDSSLAYEIYKDDCRYLIHSLDEKESKYKNLSDLKFDTDLLNSIDLNKIYEEKADNSSFLINTYKYVYPEKPDEPGYLWSGLYDKLEWDQYFKDESLRRPYYQYNINYKFLSFNEFYTIWVKPFINFVLDDKTNELMDKKMRECTYHTLNNSKYIERVETDNDAYFIYDFNLWNTDNKYDPKYDNYTEEDIRNNIVIRIFITCLKYIASVILDFRNQIEILSQTYTFINQKDIDDYYQGKDNKNISNIINKDIRAKYHQVMENLSKIYIDDLKEDSDTLLYRIFNILKKASDSYLKNEELDLKKELENIPSSILYDFFEDRISKIDISRIDNIKDLVIIDDI